MVHKCSILYISAYRLTQKDSSGAYCLDAIQLKMSCHKDKCMAFTIKYDSASFFNH